MFICLIVVIKEVISMKKSYNLLLVLTVFITLFSASLYFIYSDSLLEPANNAQSYRDRQIYYDRRSEAQPEEGAIKGKKRMNIVLLGIEGKARADTIIFISYNRAVNKLDIISIPRDTYFHETGYNRGDQRKINATYGREKEGGCVDAVAKVLCNTAVDYYVGIDYEGVEKIVDAIEGVEIEVPLDMEAGGIKITKGRQVLYGREALQYLRFRKKYEDGDIGRIKAQQKFIRSALNKIPYADIPQIIDKSFSSIRTNMPVKYMIEYARAYKDDKVKEVSMYTLPGVPMYKRIDGYNWSYFFHNPKKVKELMNKIYGVESIEQKKRKRCEPF